MIDLYFWPTPNGHKITIFLEEAGLDYRLIPVDIGKGDQFKPDFLAIAPNNRMPAIVDHAPQDGGAPLSLFESGAILRYLADKVGRFTGTTPRARAEVEQWLFWQMGGLGPMTGQWNHFNRYAPEQIPYAIDRYAKEVDRLHGVMNRRLEQAPYLAGAYSIADMASYPWTIAMRRPDYSLDKFPALVRWLDAIAARPAVIAAYQKGEALRGDAASPLTPEAKKILFGQTSAVVAPASPPTA